MARLTERLPDGTPYVPACILYSADGMQRVVSKLADYEDKQEQELLIKKDKLDKYKLALFAVIRNSTVMPIGMAQGRSMEEINTMALKTVDEVLSMCDFVALGQHYSEAEEALAKMEGKDDFKK